MADDALPRCDFLVIDDFFQDVHQRHIQLVRLRDAQADGHAALGVRLHQQNLFPSPCKAYSQVYTGGCFAHPSLLI